MFKNHSFQVRNDVDSKKLPLFLVEEPVSEYDRYEPPFYVPQEKPSLVKKLIWFTGIASIVAAYLYGVFDPAFWLKPQLTGVDKLLSENPLIDGHNDLLILIRGYYQNRINDQNFTTSLEKGGLLGQFDLPRADRGRLGGAFWSAFVPCPEDGLDFSDEAYAPYVRATLDQLDLFHRLSERYPKYFTLAHNAKKAFHNFHIDHKLISPLAIEGLHQIGNSISTLRLYHRLGVRYATLNWNCHTRYSDAAVITPKDTGVAIRAPPYWGGVSPAGRKLILEMNRLGMIVDLSHVSPDTMRDVLGGNLAAKNWTGSVAPPIFSHSSAYALCPHPRNVPDDVLDLVKARKSLVMVNFSPDFISCRARSPDDPEADTGLPEYVNEDNTLAQVAAHILYIGRRIGFEHVGIGSDFDGIETTPRGLEDVGKFPALFEYLLKAGVSSRDAAKVAGGNLLRVWREVDEVAERLQRTLEPLEDDLRTRSGGIDINGIRKVETEDR
jgi:membrane dipeptidase